MKDCKLVVYAVNLHPRLGDREMSWVLILMSCDAIKENRSNKKWCIMRYCKLVGYALTLHPRLEDR